MTESKLSGGRRQLDRTNRRILRLLQQNAHISNKDLAREVNLSPTPCLRRVGLLEEAGYIKRFRAVLDPGQLGLTIRAFLSIKRSRDSDQLKVSQSIARLPEVISCHVVSGEYDLLAEIVATDMEQYAKLTLETISRIDGVHDLRTTFSIRTIKVDGDYPIGDSLT